ncbi:hypothetical protein ACOYZY_12150 [Salibacterium aidingense]
MAKRRNKMMVGAAALILAAAGSLLLFSNVFMGVPGWDDHAPAYDTAEQAAKGFIEEKGIWKSTAWIKTKSNEDILLSEHRNHRFIAGHIIENDGSFQHKELSPFVSYRAEDGSPIESGGSFTMTDSSIVEQPYELIINTEETHPLPGSVFAFSFVRPDGGGSGIETFEILKGLRQKETLPVSATFESGGYTMIGEEGTVGMIYDKNTSPFRAGVENKYMWHFWGEVDELNAPFHVEGEKVSTGETVDLFEAQELAEPNNGADAHIPSTLRLPSSGKWKLKAYLGDELVGTIVVNVLSS